MSAKKAALQIIGIISAIIVGCILLSIFVGVPLLKNMKYNNAIKNAEAGQYEAAINELDGRNMDEYKDVKQKKQEYAIAMAKEHIETKEYEKAYATLKYAVSLKADKDLTTEAESLFKEIQKLVPYVD